MNSGIGIDEENSKIEIRNKERNFKTSNDLKLRNAKLPMIGNAAEKK
jgi:hypothetical protein